MTTPPARRRTLRAVASRDRTPTAPQHVLRNADGVCVSEASFLAALRRTGSFLASVGAAELRRSPRWMTAVHELGGRHGLRLAIRECDGLWMVLDIDWDPDGQDAAGPRDDWRGSMSRHPSGHLHLVDEPDGSDG